MSEASVTKIKRLLWATGVSVGLITIMAILLRLWLEPKPIVQVNRDASTAAKVEIPTR